MKSALLIVDVQIDLFCGERPVYAGDQIVAQINHLIARIPEPTLIVAVQDDDVGPFGQAGWNLHPDLLLPERALRMRKRFADSFYQTTLHELLQSHQIAHLIVVGAATDACIDATCRRAVSLGYDVTLVADAHTTRDNVFLAAPQSIAYYNRILDGFGLEDGFGNGVFSVTVTPSAEVELA